MPQGVKGIGMKKHGVSGKSGKSPKLRQYLKREAEKDERKAPPPLDCSSVQELMDKHKK